MRHEFIHSGKRPWSRTRALQHIRQSMQRVRQNERTPAADVPLAMELSFLAEHVLKACSRRKALSQLTTTHEIEQTRTGLMPNGHGHNHSPVKRIGAFAVAARPAHLRPDIRQLYKRNILDSLGCAIAALPGKAFQALREQFQEYRSPGRCTLIAGGKTSVDQACTF